MNKLVPDEWIIGRRRENSRDKNSKIDETCYLTFIEGKDKQGRERINSNVSFNNWSDRELDIRFQNDFIEGWKLEEDFNQRSWQSNRKLFKIREPRHNHIFEVDVRELIPLLINVHIKDGVFQGKYALTKSRSLISEAQYEKYYKETTRNINERTIREGDIMDVPRYGRYIYCGIYTKFVMERRYGENQEKIKPETLHYFVPCKDNAEIKRKYWRDTVISRASIKMDKLGECTPQELIEAQARALKEVQNDGWSQVSRGFKGAVSKDMKFEISFKIADKSDGNMTRQYLEKDGVFYSDYELRYENRSFLSRGNNPCEVTHTIRRIDIDQDNLVVRLREPTTLRYTIKDYGNHQRYEVPAGYKRAQLMFKVSK